MKYKHIVPYYTDVIFRRGEHAYRNRRTRWAARFYKVLYRTITGLTAHDTIARSAALTFYTLISLVPILALIFAVMNAVGMIETLVEKLYDVLPQDSEVTNYVIEFANKTLANTRGGVIAIVSVVTLLWAVIRLFSNVESAFNNIWEVKKGRPVTRQWAMYLIVVVIVPLLWILASAFGANVVERLAGGNYLLTQIFGKGVAVMMIWLMLTLIYVAVPNIRVRWRAAVIAAGVAGVFFALFQWGYVYLQSWMTSYSAIYGSFAALPLFLLWVQISWEIILIGGEVSRACQMKDVPQKPTKR